MVYYYFINAFPVYDIKSKDKPNLFTSDPEVSPLMEFIIKIDDSLLCFQNKPGFKTIACEGKIFYKFRCETAKTKKQEFDKEYDQNLGDVHENTKLVWLMEVGIQELCPFICSLGQLNGLTDFSKVKKRQLFSPFEIFYSSRLDLCKYKDENSEENIEIFGVDSIQDIFIERVKVKLSIQDMHLIFQILSFAKENLQSEILKKFDKIEQIKRQDQLQSQQQILDNGGARLSPKVFVRQSLLDSRPTQMNQKNDNESKTGSIWKRSMSIMNQNIENEEEDFDQLFAQIQNKDQEVDKNSMASQFQKLRSTTLAFSKIADKYTSVYNRGSELKKIMTKNLFKENLHVMYEDQNEDQEESEYYNKSTIGNAANIKEEDEDYDMESQLERRVKDQNKNVEIEVIYMNDDNNKKRSITTMEINKRSNANIDKDNQSSYKSNKLQVQSNKTNQSKIASHSQKELLTDDNEHFEDGRSEVFYSFKSKQVKNPTIIKNSIKTYDNNEIIEKEKEQDEKGNLSKSLPFGIKKTVFDNVNKSKILFEAGGIQILFINDFDQVFCPVLDINIPDIQFSQKNDITDTSLMEFKIYKLKVFYYNAKIGDWEPFIENFQVECQVNQVKNQKFIKIDFDKPIVFNMTDSCMLNLIESYNSWMATPPFQLDDESADTNKTQLSINTDEQESDDNADFKEERSKSALADFFNDGHEIDQVTPYSIKNLTKFALKIMSAQHPLIQKNRMQQDLEINFDNKTESGKTIQPPQDQSAINKIYKLKSGDECQYAVEYEQQTKFLQDKKKKKNYNQSQTMITIDNMTQNQSVRLNMTQNKEPKTPQTVLKTKSSEIISVFFDDEDYAPINNIDLNEISSFYNILKPNDQQNNNTEVIKYNGSMVSQINIFKGIKKNKEEETIQSQFQHYIVYGVTMNKMRKILTIRTPFVIFNKTLFSYSIIISERVSGIIHELVILQTGKQFAIDFKYYNGYDMQIKLTQNLNNDQQELEEYKHNQEDQKQFSTKCFIEEFMNMPIETGVMVQHNQYMNTYIKKQNAELKQAFDLVLMPPLVVKNGLPCELSIISSSKFEDNKINKFDQENKFKIGKGQEKQFHIFTYSNEMTEEIMLEFKLSGYCPTKMNLKHQLKKGKFKQYSTKTQEMDIECQDTFGNLLQVGARIQCINAFFHVTFFAHTCIINHSLFKMRFHYDSINKPLLAGQETQKDFILANKDSQFIVKLKDGSISKSIKVKAVGIKEEFNIISGGGFVENKKSLEIQKKKSNSPRNKSKNKPNKNLSVSQRYKKYDFVYTAYPSLAIEDDFIYTKIIQISPKFVVVNKMRSPLCLSQEGCEDYYFERLNPNERREWIWPNAGHAENMIIKRPNFNEEMVYQESLSATMVQQSKTEKRLGWNWSTSFPVENLGQISVQIKKKGAVINNERSKKIVRVIKKLIDNTIFVIFEDESNENPFYKIENACQNLIINFVQEGFEMDEEGQLLMSSSETSYAFIDNKQDQIIKFDIAHKEQPDKWFINKKCDLKKMGKDDPISYKTIDGQQKKLHLTIYTNGYTKIIRFSNKSLQQEKLDSESKQYNLSKIYDRYNKTTIEVTIKEINVSIISPVIRKKKREIQIKRKEICLITIGNVKFNQFTNSQLQQTSASIEVFQIDNQSKANVLFPTIFQQKYDLQKKNQFLQLSLVLNLEKENVTFVDDLEVTLSGITIKLDDEFLGYALNFAYNILEMMKTNFTGIHPIFLADDYSFTNEYDEHNIIQKLSNSKSREKMQFIKIENFIGSESKISIQPLQSKSESKQLGIASPISKANQKKSIRKIKNKKNANKIEQANKKPMMIEEIKLQQQIEIRHTDYFGADNNENLQKQQEEQQKKLMEDESLNKAAKFQSWQLKKLEDHEQKLYINTCKLSGIELEISFLARKKFQLGEKEDTYQLKKYINSSGLALINIDEAPIIIRGKQIDQTFADQGDVQTLFIKHYTDGLRKNLYKLIGSTSLLGNPGKFFRVMEKGVKDLFNEPIEGYRNEGVRQMFTGLAKGTGSLAKNTVEGSFGFIQSISEGVSKGILLISQDKDYLCKREEKLLTEKPKNFVEGIGFGCQTAINSVISGVSGMVVMPIKEGKKNGFTGAMIGTLSGSIGVILKPVSGTLDLVAKSAEGIKNTAKIFESKVFKDRQRLPRPFYGMQQQIKNYSDSDSYIVVRILNTIKERIFRKDHYIETIKFEEQQRTLFLIITEEHLILLEVAQKSVWWHIQRNLICDVEKYQNGLRFQLKQKFEGKRNVAIEINKMADIEKIYSKVKIYTQ